MKPNGSHPFSRDAHLRSRAMAQLRTATQTGLLTAVDRFNRRLAVGDLVLFRPNTDLVFQVVDLKPILDPQAPPGHVLLTLSVTFGLPVPVAQPLIHVIKMGTVEGGIEAPGTTDAPEEETADPVGDAPGATDGIVLTDGESPTRTP